MPKRQYPLTAPPVGSWKKKKMHHPSPSPNPPSTPPSHFPGLTPKDAIILLQGYLGWLRNSPQNGGGSYSTFTQDADGNLLCRLRMPPNSPIAEIESSGYFDNERDAKHSAAYNSILALHAIGEFNDKLVPTPKNATNPEPPAGAVQLVYELTAKIFGTGAPTFSKHFGKSISSSGKRSSATSKSRSDTPDSDRAVKRAKAASELGVIAAEAEHARAYCKSEASKTAHFDGSSPATYPCKRPQFWESKPISNNAYGAVLTVHFRGAFGPDEGGCSPMLLVTAAPLPFGEAINLDTQEADVNVRTMVGVSAPLELTSAELDMTFEWTRLCMRAVMNNPLDCRLEDCGWVLLPLARSFSGSTASRDDVAWDDVRRVEDGPVRDFDPQHLNEEELRDSVLSWPKEFCRRYYFRRIRRDLRPYSICPRDSTRTILELIGGLKAPRLDYPLQDIIEGTVAYGANHNGCVGSFTGTWREQHLVPELLKIHMLRAGVFKTATLLPQIFTVLDEHLLALELSETLFAGRLDRALIRSAVRVPYIGSDNYSRLESLGHAVRTFIVAVGVFHKAAVAATDISTTGQTRKLSTRHIARGVDHCGVSSYIRRKPFTTNGWAPHDWVYADGRKVSVPTRQTINDYTLADVGEALVGAAYLSTSTGKPPGSMPLALEAIRVLGLKSPLESWDVLAAGIGSRTGSLCNPWNITAMGYKFWNLSKGEVVMTLPPGDEVRSKYEQYEFLGAALLDFLTFETLWTEQPDVEAEQLTAKKEARITCAVRSTCVAVSEIFNSIHISDEIAFFLKAYHADVIEAHDAAKAGQRELLTSFPENKVLGSFLHAVLGAIFDDSGGIDAVRQAYKEHIAPFQNTYLGKSKSPSEPKTKLNDLMLRRGCKSWCIDKNGGDEPGALFHATVIVHDHEAGTSAAQTELIAVQNACNHALGAVDQLLQRFCTCPSRTT